MARHACNDGNDRVKNPKYEYRKCVAPNKSEIQIFKIENKSSNLGSVVFVLVIEI
jgi:hypothetical protein